MLWFGFKIKFKTPFSFTRIIKIRWVYTTINIEDINKTWLLLILQLTSVTSRIFTFHLQCDWRYHRLPVSQCSGSGRLYRDCNLRNQEALVTWYSKLPLVGHCLVRSAIWGWEMIHTRRPEYCDKLSQYFPLFIKFSFWSVALVQIYCISAFFLVLRQWKLSIWLPSLVNF